MPILLQCKAGLGQPARPALLGLPDPLAQKEILEPLAPAVAGQLGRLARQGPQALPERQAKQAPRASQEPQARPEPLGLALQGLPARQVPRA